MIYPGIQPVFPGVVRGGVGAPPFGGALSFPPGAVAAWRKNADGSLTEYIGLSTADYANVDPAIRSIFFVNATTLRAAADAVTLALASPLLNVGTMVGSTTSEEVALYTYGTPDATLKKAVRYFKETFTETASFTVATGSSETDYILPIFAHHGLQAGDAFGNNVWFGGRGATNFSDVKFFDGATELDHYLHSYGNYEVVPDHTKVASVSVIAPDGTIYAVQTDRLSLAKSTDNGATWTTIYTGASMGVFIFMDSAGNLFANNITTRRLIKSADSGENWTAVGPDMTAVGGLIVYNAMVEDSDGNLYFGRYQDANEVKIYKSTDNGDNWSDITPAIATGYQHVHGMHVDSYQTPEAIYAGLDGNGTGILKSVGAGANWTLLSGTPADANPNGFGSGTGFRLFSGEASINGGWSIFRTTDDATFTPVLNTAQTITGIRRVGDVFFAFGAANGANGYSQIYRSEDNGLTWETIWTGAYDEDGNASAGMRYPSIPGTPINGDLQIMVGALEDTAGATYKNSRVYEGGNHHSAMIYLKIPTLPAEGKTITASFGTAGTSSKALFDWDAEIGVEPLFHYKLNEGTGTAITDSSSNGNNGVLTPGTGAWSAEKRRAGWTQPDITETGGAGFEFNGDGKIAITGSDTNTDFSAIKNCTLIAWFDTKNASATTLRWLAGRGRYAHATFPFAITFRDNGALQFTYAASGAIRNAGASSSQNLTDGAIHMVAATLDNATPPNITWTIDTLESSPAALAYTPENGTQSAFNIGAASDGTYPMKSNVAEVMFFNTALTKEQKRRIFEAR